MRRPFPFPTLAWILCAGLAALAAFTGYKTYVVARELVDPPFYQVQPLERVERTYQELANGDDSDPGGTWSSEEKDGLQLWTLTRAKPAPGVVVLLHGFGDDRWGTSPALRWFPDLDAVIFTYRRRDDALRSGTPVPPVTFGARESEEVIKVVHALEARGVPRRKIVLMGRSLGASVGILALTRLEGENQGPLGGLIWEGAPAGSRDFGQRLVRGTKDRFWHPLLAPLIGALGSTWAGRMAGYDPRETDLLDRLRGRRLMTPSLCFLATQDRLAPPEAQRAAASHFARIERIEVPTWHLNCSTYLGTGYARAIRAATIRWLP